MKYRGLIFLTIASAFLFFNIYTSTKAESTDLFISEYVEGTSNNKAIEIYNPTGSAIDLSLYKLESFINGSLTPSVFATASAVLDPNSTFVFCNSSADPAILSVCDKTISGVGTVMTFNGNDAIVLSKSDGTFVDALGQVGVDPGTQWGTELTSTQDNTIRRKCFVTGGDTNGADIFDPVTQWDGYTVNTFDGLGSHSTCFQTPIPSDLPSPTPTLDPSPTPTETASPTPSPTPEPVATSTPMATFAPSPTPEIATPMPTKSPKHHNWEEDFHDFRNWCMGGIRKTFQKRYRLHYFVWSWGRR